jgi:hypothetical protein
MDVLQLQERVHGKEWVLIMKKEVAENISKLMLEYAAKLNDSVRLVMENCPKEEFHVYRRAVGKVMGEMLEIINPLYREHPDLRPEGLNPPPPERHERGADRKG